MQNQTDFDGGMDVRGRSAIFVTGFAGVDSGDRAVIALMDELGLDYRVVRDNEVATRLRPLPDLLVISSSARSFKVAPFLQNLPVPVVTWEPWLFDDLRLTGPIAQTDYGFEQDSVELEIAAPTHPLAAGLTGTPTVYGQVHAIGWGKPGPDADVIAYSTASGAPSIFAYDRGSKLLNGKPAPARRVGFFAHTDDSYQFSSAGRALLYNALSWASAAEGNANGISASHAVLLAASTSLHAADESALDLMDDLGLNPRVVTMAEFASLADGTFDLVVVSNTVHSSRVSARLARVQTPIVLWEPWLYDDLAMTGPQVGSDFSYDYGVGAIEIAALQHPISGNLSGIQRVYANSPSIGWGDPADGAQVVAVHPQTGMPALFGFEAGSTLFDGTSAPARRVGLFANTNGERHFTTEGLRLMTAALQWALYRPASSEPVDAGVTPPPIPDAGEVDAPYDGSVPDAGGESQPPIVDAGSGPEAPTDAGSEQQPTDAGSEPEPPTDAGSVDAAVDASVDAGGEPEPEPLAFITEPQDGATAVSLRPSIRLLLSEPIPVDSDLSVIQVLDGSGAALAVLRTLSSDRMLVQVQPFLSLDPDSEYTLLIGAGLIGDSGAVITPQARRFTTEPAPPDPADFTVEASRVDQRGAAVGVTLGPDGQLYTLSIMGNATALRRYALDPLTGLPSGPAEDLYITSDQVLGMAFEPQASATDASYDVWISHASCNSLRGRAPAHPLTGGVSRLTIPALGRSAQTERELFVTGLPTALHNCAHQVNGLQFGPDGRLYVSIGSGTSLGGSPSWGTEESPLSAAVVTVDLNHPAFGPGERPLSVASAVDGAYDATASDAPLQLFATGVRAGFDLLWHSNGNLYTAINQNSRSEAATYPCNGLPAIRQLPPEVFALLKAGNYYGHPNASRGQCVLLGGNPTLDADPYEIRPYPVGTAPEAGYDPSLLYNLRPSGGNSPNGLTEFTGSGPLQGRVLIAYLTGSMGIQTLGLSSDGRVINEQMLLNENGSPLRFRGALDVAVHPLSGVIYVAVFGDITSGAAGGIYALTPAP